MANMELTFRAKLVCYLIDGIKVDRETWERVTEARSAERRLILKMKQEVRRAMKNGEPVDPLKIAFVKKYIPKK